MQPRDQVYVQFNILQFTWPPTEFMLKYVSIAIFEMLLEPSLYLMVTII